VTVAIVTDSAAALDPALARRYGITVVPMEVVIGGSARSESEVTLEEVVANLDSGVQTSGPSPGAFMEAVKEVSAFEVLILTVAQRFSSTYQAAVTGARLATGPKKVRVLDTGTAAGAEGLVVLAAADEAAKGASLEEVEARALLASRRVRLVATIDGLTHLVRGGRLPQPVARAASLLGVRPLFELDRGHIRPLRPSLSNEGAIEQVIAQWRRSQLEGARLHVCALHAGRRREAEELLATVTAELKPATSFVGCFSPVMVAHTGPTVLGLAWWWDES
jgi:DegV family protein with EDD domain